MKVKGRDRSMLVVGNAGKQRFTEYFYGWLNLVDDIQATIAAIGGDRRMPVFGRLNDGGVESYEVEEGFNNLKDGKAPWLAQ